MVSVVLSYNGIGHCFHCGACPVYQEKSAGMVSLLWVFRFYVCRDSHRLLRISTDWDILGGKHERLVGACHHTRDVICGCCLAVFTRQIRFSFFDSEQDKLSDLIPVVIVVAIAIGILFFMPILVKLVKTHYVVIFFCTILFALKWVIDECR